MSHGKSASTEQIASSTRMIVDEISAVISQLDFESFERVADMLLDARGVFTCGGGRSGLALQMFAMRLMHLGLSSHVVGETTAPAVGEKDVLVAASGSGTTKRVVRAAEASESSGARVVAITTTLESPLAEISDEVLLIPTAEKHSIDRGQTQQYAGSLFEQTLLVTMDGLFHAMWKAGGASAEELLTHHANLE